MPGDLTEMTQVFICMTTAGANKSGLRQGKGTLCTVETSFLPHPHLVAVEGPIPYRVASTIMGIASGRRRLYEKAAKEVTDPSLRKIAKAAVKSFRKEGQ